MSGLELLATVLTAVFAFLSLLAGLLFRLLKHPKGRYKSEVRDIQDDRWNDACGELGPVVAEAYEYVSRSDNDHSPDELLDGEKASVILRRVLDSRDDLGDLEDKLESIDEPKQAYRRCRKDYTYIPWILSGGSTGFGVSAVVLWFAPESMVFTAIGASTTTVSVVVITVGVYVAYRFSNAQNDLDEMTEETEFR
ncbi:hypothetical protein NGM10_16060 (plasmid) [Halorussus salilacus]|uniref:hypothetical protein n=1 Tax=Halorussus salilacus TaxID=2953750 RepID=UPI00209FD59D|nr:hypothetical protein [Halorussus salilacus]USZ69917.1 hypothetical protein NGM10_16060 [Halorussus salilacus]